MFPKAAIPNLHYSLYLPLYSHSSLNPLTRLPTHPHASPNTSTKVPHLDSPLFMSSSRPPPPTHQPASSYPMAASDDEPEFENFPYIDAAHFADIVNPGGFIFAEPEEMNMKLVSRVVDCIILPMMIPNPSNMASDSRIVTDNLVPKMESVEVVNSHPPPINPIIENPVTSMGMLFHPQNWPGHLNQMASEGAGASIREASVRKTSFKTNLKLLIEKGVISDMEELRYLSKKGERTVMGKGKATTKGVLCDCCGNVLTLSNFEAHAKSNYHRPAENIFLADGRSLQECYLEAMKGTAEKDQVTSSPTLEEIKKIDNDLREDEVSTTVSLN